MLCKLNKQTLPDHHDVGNEANLPMHFGEGGGVLLGNHKYHPLTHKVFLSKPHINFVSFHSFMNIFILLL